MCKHEYIILFAEDPRPNFRWNYEDNGARVIAKYKVGCSIYCHKCGKIKKHLSKKIGKIYANTVAFGDRQKLENTFQYVKNNIHIHDID